MYAAALVKKRRYYRKLVIGDLIYAHFEDKKVVDFGMIEGITEDNKLFNISFMNDPDYVMRIMVSCMTLDEL